MWQFGPGYFYKRESKYQKNTLNLDFVYSYQNTMRLVTLYLYIFTNVDSLKILIVENIQKLE